MKTFLYSTETKKQKYGNQITASVYKLSKNKPLWLGDVVMYSQSMRGIDGEINNWLIENKHIPKTWQERGGYVNYSFYGHDKKYYFYKI